MTQKFRSIFRPISHHFARRCQGSILKALFFAFPASGFLYLKVIQTDNVCLTFGLGREKIGPIPPSVLVTPLAFPFLINHSQV